MADSALSPVAFNLGHRFQRIYRPAFLLGVTLLGGSIIGGFYWSLSVQRRPPELKLDSLQLGELLIERGKYDAAVEEYQMAARINPDDVNAYVGLSKALGKLGDNEGELAALKRARDLRPNDPRSPNALGMAYERQGKLDDAANYYSQAARLDSQYSDARVNLGNVFLRQGKLEEAVASYEDALRINPKLADAHNGLGAAWATRGDFRRAVAAFAEAVRINPDSESAKRNLAQAEARLKRSEGQIPASKP